MHEEASGNEVAVIGELNSHKLEHRRKCLMVTTQSIAIAHGLFMGRRINGSR